MTFNSLFFFLTLLLVLGLYHALHRSRPRLARFIVLSYSYFFYGLWNPWFVLLLVGTTVLDFYLAQLIVARPVHKRTWVTLSIVSNLGILAFFKYFYFAANSVAFAANFLGLEWNPTFAKIILPVGISFYTFQTLSYTIDVYRGRLAASSSLLDFAFFVSFFPQLVAGPIVRAADFLPQLTTPRTITSQMFADGIFLIVWGLFLKVVVADNVAARANVLFGSWQTNGAFEQWAAAMLFGVQIYGDFAGYSSIAIGIAALFGYELTLNFNHPYGAVGFSDFWKRWHISLSSWLRDYLYIPLGGNRRGEVRTYANLMITMLLGGLWHGASWMFVIWGGLHGFYLGVEKWLRGRFGQAGDEQRSFAVTLLLAMVTFATVSITWIPFRASELSQTIGMIGGMFAGGFRTYPQLASDFAIIGAVFMFEFTGARASFIERVLASVQLRYAVLVLACLSLFYFAGGSTEFIYFQF